MTFLAASGVAGVGLDDPDAAAAVSGLPDPAAGPVGPAPPSADLVFRPPPKPASLLGVDGDAGGELRN